jgi:hypothetical protein
MAKRFSRCLGCEAELTFLKEHSIYIKELNIYRHNDVACMFMHAYYLV